LIRCCWTLSFRLDLPFGHFKWRGALSTNDATRHCHLPRTAAVTKGEGGAGMGVGVGVSAELKGRDVSAIKRIAYSNGC